MGPGMLVANAASMSIFAKVLTPELERPVRDKTNLNGRYDIRLKWMPEIQPPGRAGGQDRRRTLLICLVSLQLCGSNWDWN